MTGNSLGVIWEIIVILEIICAWSGGVVYYFRNYLW